MVEIKSQEGQINKGSNEVYEYLIAPANYEILMPKKVRSFTSTPTSAVLDIEGIGKVELGIVNSIVPSQITMKPQNRVPFKFDINWYIQANTESSCRVVAIINADLNLMMKMMAESLLRDFLNVQVEKLTAHLNS